MEDNFKRVKHYKKYGKDFLVTGNGNIYKIKNNKWELCKVSKINDYSVISIQNDNKKQKILYIHRIIAELFVDRNHEEDMVTFKDNNKNNINIDNLEWITNEEKMRRIREYKNRD